MRLLKGFLLALSFLPSVVFSQGLVIEITQGVDGAFPIAVVPFKWQGPTLTPPEDLSKIVAADLHRSGRFRVIQDNLPELPSDVRQVNFEKWRKFGVDAVVTGVISQSPDLTYQVSYQLIDVYRGSDQSKQEVTNGELVEVESRKALLDAQTPTITIRDQDLRNVAHYFSDRIYQQLIGEQGAFQTKLAYINVRTSALNEQEFTLVMSDADGERALDLWKSDLPLMSPSWSPDGEKLAYVSFDGHRASVIVQEIYTGKRRKVSATPGINGAPSWSPDGKFLALTLSKDGNPEIYILELTTGKLKRITRHWGIDTEAKWAPDGRSIIFTSDRGGGPQIYRYSLDTRQVKRLTFEGRYNARASFTSDGKRLIMVHRHKQDFNIATLDLRTGYLDILTETLLDESPSLAPNNSMVIYAAQDGDQGVLGAVSIDGRVKLKLPAASGEVRDPAWSPFLN
ncbi:Tol-Pal system beta propeller repeat protein TolB [Pelagibaculum spongiae]|uniref:Tol-Pal system protein TolB n=1 Tax=Pelagibaculum spongiae TaxID=2080658 RepID=A0A2V1H0C3_9GAMM|nr:Tol-Pal system beta propeller repeat protein TolB [Pelagibaculum spongiae]PVZ69442.1 Tol-Pal system beta propeller repeat protein TolB [Pelagibaculum spongiae]